MRKELSGPLCAIVTAVTLQAAAAAAAVPVIVALDASRSLSAADLAAAATSLQAMVRQLPADVPVGVLEFGDATRWRARADAQREAALAALAAIEPAGRTTLLNDALFEIARSLPSGGVIVLASDGRDENSATTPDDVARICTANGVRIVAVAIGRRLEERALRRLALLTDGGYVGPQRFGEATNLVIAVEGARRGVAERLAKLAPPPTARPIRVAATPAPAAPARDAGIPAMIPIGLALAAVVAVAAILLWRRQRAEEHRPCPRCGMPLEVWDSECPHCRAEEERSASEVRERQDREALATAAGAPAPSQSPAKSIETAFGPELLARAELDEPIDKTFVLGEQFVLVVKEPRKVARSYLLAPDQPFTVGRAPKVNAITINDPTMSAQHFRIVYKDGAYFIADLETTNGTFIDGERIRVHRLQPGDKIRAGEVEFEFRLQLAKRTA